MALDFGILQPVNIAGNILAGQQETQRNQLAQQQLAMGGLQQQKAQLDINDLTRRQAGLDKFVQDAKQAHKSGSEEDMVNSYYDYAVNIGDPQHLQHAMALKQAVQDRKQFGDLVSRMYPTAATAAAPATAALATAAPTTAAPAPANTFGINNMGGMSPTNFTDQTAMAGNQPSFASATPVAPQTPTAAMTAAASVTNALAPAAPAVAPAVNNLPAAITATSGASQIAELKRDIAALSLSRDPRAKALLTMKENELKTLQTPHVIPNVGLANAAGDVFVKAPATPTNLSRLQAELDALPPNDPRRAQYIGMIQKETQFAPSHLAQLIKERDALQPGDPNRKVYDTEINKTQTEIENQKAHLRLAQNKYSQDYAQGTFKPETIDMMANLLIQTGNIPPLGMGKKAADARAQIMNRAQEISTGTGATPAQAATNMANNKGEYVGSISGQRAVGTQIANTQVAANETNKMIGIAKPYVDKVNPTDYPVVNAVGNYVAKNTGDPNVVGLATSLNAIVNTYARAINPKGVATVSDKNHAREILNAAMSKGQLNEAFNVMQQEMNAALASGPETKANLRNSNAPATPAPAGAVDTNNKWLK